MANDTPVGFHLPLFRSLTEQALLAGAPASVMVFNVAAAAIFILTFHFFYVIPLHIVIHIVAVYLSRIDAQFFECLARYVKQKHYYCT